MTGLDRDKALPILANLIREASQPVEYNEHGHDTGMKMRDVLDALEECVTPNSAQTIDRDALVRAVHEEIMRGAKSEAIADRVLALLRPDTRIAALWALPVEMIDEDDASWIRVKSFVAILRGEQ